MLDLNKVPSNIKRNLNDRGHSDEAISNMSWERAFDEYCNWHGLTYWGETIRKIHAALVAAHNGRGIKKSVLPENMDNVIDDLVERGHSEDDIATMSAEDAFDEYCAWNALAGWGHDLRSTMASLKEADTQKSIT